jgi:hypothetical protein
MYQKHDNLEEQVRPVLKEHFDAYAKGKVDKNNTPFYLFLGGAGVGKSRNCMEFPRTLISCSEEDSNLRKRLEKAKVFIVSLENGTSITPREKNELDPMRMIGIRMFLQLQPEKSGIDGVLRDFEPPLPMEVFESVAKGENQDFEKEFTGIIIVDGAQNFIDGLHDPQDKSSTFYNTLTGIAELALKKAFVIPCCSATITTHPDYFLASSHRNRIYLPIKSLDPPTISENGKLVSASSRLWGPCQSPRSAPGCNRQYRHYSGRCAQHIATCSTKARKSLLRGDRISITKFPSNIACYLDAVTLTCR